jgi:hypothetical protein
MNDLAKHFVEKIQQYKDRVDFTKKQIELMRQDLRKVCDHDDVVREEKHEPGTYYDRAKYITTYTCKICGHVDRTEVTGGYG